MTKPGAKLPYEDTKLAQYLRQRIDELSSEMSQREIAAQIGYEKANIISMYKRGEAKVPLDRIPAFARVLKTDIALLFRLGLEQWWPGENHALEEIFDHVTTKNNREWLDILVDVSGEPDPAVTPERAKRLREVFQSKH